MDTLSFRAERSGVEEPPNSAGSGGAELQRQPWEGSAPPLPARA